MRILFTIFFILLSNKLSAFVPKEELFFYEIAPQAEYLGVFRPYDNKKYKIRVGIGCLPALFDDLTHDTKIYAVKLGDLLDSYGNGDIGLIYIETQNHNVSCKIIDIESY